MASVSNLSVPDSRNNPAPTFSKSILVSREPFSHRQASLNARAGSLSRFAAGILLGFSGAYVLRSPLTVGQITILAAFGILLLAKGYFRRTYE
ncbi:MAG TPA: hypothetical protein VNO32_49525 [Candidatus Acidoferrum sp.]|jgi:hypothetical protein|nr:hypothetical protein [Candidatus Acidoferrum sp.]